jgi:hypothetical protein
MRVVYTESGRQALESFKNAKANELEEQIKSRKYVYGDETIEITANDIKEAADRLRLPYRLGTSRPMTQFVLQIYILLGILTFIGGIFYRQFRDIVFKDPTQLILIVSGAMIAFMSFVILQRFRLREEERRRIERLELERERMATARDWTKDE